MARASLYFALGGRYEMSSMNRSLCILGRQPPLGLAELESLYGADTLLRVSDYAVLINREPRAVDFRRLGGSMKLARVLATLDTTSWSKIEAYLMDALPQHLVYLPGGKLQLGLSVYSLPVKPKQLLASGLTLKKAIKASGRSVRLIPNKEPALNSAQVLHNNLTGPLGWELVFVRSGSHTILAQTVAEQDIEAYAARDQNRPKRDARVGMLPPKLAQIIINLAHPGISIPHDEEHIDNYPDVKSLAGILDPFCGTGVVLQEALIMGFSVIGSDMEPRMIDYTNGNLAWLPPLTQHLSNGQFRFRQSPAKHT
jgi:hypothetical protein